MDEALETIEYKGYNIEIYPDELNDSPRDWDNLTEFHCWHRRCNLGDFNYNNSNMNEFYDIYREAKRNNDIILSLYIYEHGGITISLSNDNYPFNDRWDSGQIGYVIVRRKKMIEEFGKKIFTPKLKKRAIEIVKSDVKVYDQFLRGDVYGYVIEKDGENIDSCWGYYGMEDVTTEAQSVVDYDIKNNIKKHCEKVKCYIKNNVPLLKRVTI